ncbi:MAG: sugar MFS transporter, partial [Phycisphaerae bacterium]
MSTGRLFVGSCFALTATSVCFGVVGASMGALKEQFILSNEQVGWIGGAALWGFTISIFVLGPLCDVLGMRNLLRFALLCHAVGTLLMIFATGFWMLFFGALILALGNGTVEAACNPLVATIYPYEKTKKLNQFHVWFPGGIVIGGVAAYLLDQVGLTNWQVKLALILVPTVIYGLIFAGQKFPATERVQSGVSFGGMVQGALLRPLFLILLACMAITASLELGPNRWVPAVLEAGGIPGILVLAYISGLMAVLRFFAGPVVYRLSPTGILVASAVLSGAGLYWLSFAETTVMAFLSATVFAVGVCYFWPTMLGVTSERVPKSGALGLALMGGMGML